MGWTAGCWPVVLFTHRKEEGNHKGELVFLCAAIDGHLMSKPIDAFNAISIIFCGIPEALYCDWFPEATINLSQRHIAV